MAPHVVNDAAGSEFLGLALDTFPSNIAIIDADGRILATNSSWREFAEANDIQRSPTSVGENYLDIAEAGEDQFAERSAAGLRAVLEGERDSFELEYPCHSPDEKRWFLLRAAAFTRGGDRYATVEHVDVTERTMRERALQTAYEISASDRPFSDKVDDLLDLGCGVFGLEFGALSHIQDDEYTFEAAATPDDADIAAGDTAPLATLPKCERVVDTEETLVLRDVHTEAPELLGSEWGATAYLGAPVVVNEEVQGTFCFYSTEARDEQFSDWEVTFLELLTDWVSNALERRHYTDLLGALDMAFPDLAFLIDTDGTYLDYLVNPAMADRLTAGRDDLFGQTLHEILPGETADTLLAAVREAVDTGQLQTVEYELDVPAGIRWFEARIAQVAHGTYGPDTVVFVARDITDRKEREQKLQQRRDELTQLDRLNTLVRELMQALRDTDSREAIETAVCNRLTESELYQSAWVGVRGANVSGEQTILPQTTAGIDRAHLDGVSDSWSAMKTAVRTGEVQVVADIAQSGELPAAHREHALELGHEAVAVVPLTTGEVTYGVLAVYPPSDQTIRDGERTVLADLGQMIAQAIQRVHSQHALSAETLVHLDLKIPDIGFVVGDVSTEFDCELTLEQAVTTDDDGGIYYFGVRDADPERVCEFLRETPVAGEYTVVRDADRGTPPLVEFSLDDHPSPPMDVLNDYGGSMQTVRIADGDLFLGVELPPSVDVRTVVDALEEVVSPVQLISKQYVDRPIETTPDPWGQIAEQLTTKQSAALEAAHTRGYYDWPREVTVEELAKTFDVTAPTLHYRLRHAHQTVVGEFVDSTRGRTDTA